MNAGFEAALKSFLEEEMETKADSESPSMLEGRINDLRCSAEKLCRPFTFAVGDLVQQRPGLDCYSLGQPPYIVTVVDQETIRGLGMEPQRLVATLSLCTLIIGCWNSAGFVEFPVDHRRFELWSSVE